MAEPKRRERALQPLARQRKQRRFTLHPARHRHLRSSRVHGFGFNLSVGFHRQAAQGRFAKAIPFLHHSTVDLTVYTTAGVVRTAVGSTFEEHCAAFHDVKEVSGLALHAYRAVHTGFQLADLMQ